MFVHVWCGQHDCKLVKLKVCGLHQIHADGHRDDGPHWATDDIKPPASKTGPGPHRQGQRNGTSIEEVEAFQGLQEAENWSLGSPPKTVPLGPNGIAPETQSLGRWGFNGSTSINILR